MSPLVDDPFDMSPQPHSTSFVARLAAVCLAGLLASEPASALDPGKTILQYSHRSWETSDGLPQNSVHAIAQTPDGYLWLGTRGGLVRFDGVRFQLFDRRNTPEPRNHHVWDLEVDGDGTLWIATNGGGLVGYRDGDFSGPREPGSELPEGRILALELGRDGALWFGTYGGSVARLSSRPGRRLEDTEPSPIAADLPGASVLSLHEDREGGLWIGTYDAGVHRFRDGTVESYTAADGLADDIVWSTFQDRRGRIWIGTMTGLNRLEDDGTFTVFTEADGLSHPAIRAIHQDRDGTLWLGSYGGGLNRLREDAGGAVTFSHFFAADGLGSDNVWSLFESSEGALWLGTFGGGLHQLEDGPFLTHGRSEGLSADHATSVWEDPEGGLWVATYSAGLNRLAPDGSVVVYTAADGLPADRLWAVVGDRHGNLWIGTSGAGLARFRDGRFTTYTTEDGLAHDVVFALREDPEGGMWIGTNGGLGHYRDGVFESLTVADGLVSDLVREIRPGRDGSLWIGTSGGLSRYRDGRFVNYTSADGLPSENVWGIYEDEAGVLWLATSGGGLARLKDGRITSITSRHGLPDDDLSSILADGRGHLWLGSGRGVLRLDREELEAFAVGRTDTFSTRIYGPADGLRNSELHGGSQPAAWRGRDGRLFFPTLGGVAEVDPEKLDPSASAVPSTPPMIEEVRLDGEELSRGGTAARGAPLRVDPGVRRLSFRYTALNFRDPGQLRFRYRLEGYDDGWIDAGGQRVASYTHLPPGAYRFRVAARLAGGEWTDEVATFAFVRTPAFHERPVFLLLIATLLVFLGVMVHAVRTRRRKRREEELARRVEEALAQVKTLRGMLPICSSCKMIRDDRGYWKQLEHYLREHSEAELSHSLCPDCVAKYVPGRAERVLAGSE